MLRHLSGHLAKNVVAYLALFIALGGTSVAAVSLKKNSVKAKNIARNAVSSPKVKDRSLRAQDFALGQLPRGAQGEIGVAGAKGTVGDRGPQGAPGATKVTLRRAEQLMSPGQITFTTARCLAGETMTGGGGGFVGEVSEQRGSVIASRPTRASPFGSTLPDDGETTATVDGWQLIGKNIDPDSQDQTLYAWALCAQP